MGARIRLLRAALVAVALTLALAPATSADAFSQVYNYYRTHGNVAPCTFSAKTLQQALSAVPPDIQQYAPDFPAAIEAALQDRAQGACATKGSAVAPLVTTAPS
ncbi:MAG TPA: hypothetical protein VHX88_14690, partial [Solirubrobacteraceae bacterium]|nr:hypothetical protein [Solirubrobacteraceae bacterium]